MNKQQLASKIWESANRMRSKIEANEYKDYILGFIFYKFLSDKEVRYLKDNDWTDEYLPQVTEEDDETETYQVVTTMRQDALHGLISKESPVGKALLGKKAGDRVHIQVNEGYGYDVVIRTIEKAQDDGSVPLNSY